jgi:hypothetical protein
LPPRWRLPLLALGFVSLAAGIAGGLARLYPQLDAPSAAIGMHGALMVSAFFGSVIGLERAVALGRRWAYGAPLAAGLGGLLLLAQQVVPGLALLVTASVLLVGASLAVVGRQRSLETVALAAGAAAWLVGNACFAAALTGTYWWIAFFALTIGGERLELSRYLKRPAWARHAFALLALALLAAPVAPRALGAVLLLLALWLFAFDLARVTVRRAGLTRYVAVCLLAGYAWLALGGAGLALALPADAALHAIFVGFVFSMVLGHAPVILPAVLGVRFPYSPLLYAPLALLHASLALRVFLDAGAGAWGNAAAIALFIATAAALVLARRERNPGSV